jgi:hypothetical protein
MSQGFIRHATGCELTLGAWRRSAGNWLLFHAFTHITIPVDQAKNVEEIPGCECKAARSFSAFGGGRPGNWAEAACHQLPRCHRASVTPTPVQVRVLSRPHIGVNGVETRALDSRKALASPN